ncbi:IS110 family transposase [Mycobacterium camsae]|uniref:IS110 family transposase n=1 Tax=Mycobacterium gordonae TaxID=1778 RepID=UPI003D663913
MLFVGDDWAEDHHDVYVMNDAGDRLVSRRMPEGLAGIRAFHELVAAHGEDPAQVVIGIETIGACGWVHWLGPDTEAIKVLARAHQSLIWTRNRHTNTLRSALREYYPAALEAFDDLHDRDALATLGRAPSPVQAATPSLSKIRSALKTAGRQRNLDTRAQDIQTALRTEQLAAPAAVTAAFAATTRATVGVIAELNRQIDDLEVEVATHFETHPDADIYRSLPGLGVILGARVLGEFGDDPNRYTTAKCRKNYAGTSPLTIASGKKRAVLARHVRNRRLYDAVDQWAFCALQQSPGARMFYDQRRDAGDLHHQALRALGNRLVGILHGCLRHRSRYDEHKAWAPPSRHGRLTTYAPGMSSAGRRTSPTAEPRRV